MNQRERFEAWAAANSLNTIKHAGEYRSIPTYMAWLAWQAGSDAEREACAKLCESHNAATAVCASIIRARGGPKS